MANLRSTFARACLGTLLFACSRGGDAGKMANPSTGQSGSGVAGVNGASGISGAAGMSGASGISGAAGMSAQAGSGGANGMAGASGMAGAGANGMAGASGAAGAAGSAGAAGTGAPATPAERIDNPFSEGTGYVNPEWKAKAEAEPGGERISNTPTALWLDRIAAIEGTPSSMSNGPMGLRDHMDAALAQGASFIQIVIYNLPGRDCSALASNGELGADELPRYKAEYIDPIVAILGEPQYAGLRVIAIIEVDSLPNLVTNTGVANCATMKSNGGYVQGIAYALQELGALPNVYNYVDAGHHAWLGWDSNLGPSAQLFYETAMMAGLDTVAGFITNTANYSALKEPYFGIDTMVNGQPIKGANWVQYNQYVDELSFAQAFRTKLVELGFPDSIGMLIDTSRNGWGGSARPSAASSSTDVNAFVDASRIDRRIHAGNWCNQSGAGLGERPRANPEPGIDAYVWIKPPGESDGASMEIQNEDGKGFDRMCDPTYGGNERNGNSMTGALPGAPLSGAWFSAQFQQLMQNAHPPL